MQKHLVPIVTILAGICVSSSNPCVADDPPPGELVCVSNERSDDVTIRLVCGSRYSWRSGGGWPLWPGTTTDASSAGKWPSR